MKPWKHYDLIIGEGLFGERLEPGRRHEPVLRTPSITNVNLIDFFLAAVTCLNYIKVVARVVDTIANNDIGTNTTSGQYDKLSSGLHFDQCFPG